MSADPNSNPTAPVDTTATPATVATDGNAAPTQPAKKGFLGKMTDAFSNLSKKADEAGRKINEELTKASVQVEKEANVLIQTFERDMNKLNDQAQTKAKQELPNNMADLLVQATNSLDAQLKVIQQELIKLKERKTQFVSPTLQQLKLCKLNVTL